MSAALALLNNDMEAIENLPGYNVAMDLWGEYAGEHFHNKGKQVQRKT